MRAWLLVASLVLAGCKAQPLGVHDGGPADLAVPVVVDFAHPADMTTVSTDMAFCPMGVPEICGNGCDDDLNGYIDGDDPACTTQLLVTMRMGTQPSLSRLVLEPVPKLIALDGNPVPGEAFAVFNHAFSPAAYVALASSSSVSVRPLDGGVADNLIAFNPRDACVFNGELLVVENHFGAPMTFAKLHRYPPGGPNATGSNELMPPITAIAPFIDACASDGNVLYVSRHDNSTAAGQFIVIDKTRTVVGAPIALPSGLPAGYNRCLDFAWTKKSGVFIGLFNKGTTVEDPTLDGKLMAPFGFDGGLGPGIDGGVWHGIGEFLP
jgi:hypothetical protein